MPRKSSRPGRARRETGAEPLRNQQAEPTAQLEQIRSLQDRIDRALGDLHVLDGMANALEGLGLSITAQSFRRAIDMTRRSLSGERSNPRAPRDAQRDAAGVEGAS